ncbi:MAG: cell division protein ZapA [Pseudomonadota bacterium]
MSESDVARVTVKILDKEYHVACPASERADLTEAAAYLHGKMREIRDTGKVVGVDRIAVIAALNMANELVKTRGRGERLEGDVGTRLKGLRKRVETALGQGTQLEL